jgi:uncharacterized protein YbcV (DUF1398 family)
MEPKIFCRTVATQLLKPPADSRDNVDLSQLIIEFYISNFVLSANWIIPRSLLTVLQNKTVIFLKKDKYVSEIV